MSADRTRSLKGDSDDDLPEDLSLPSVKKTAALVKKKATKREQRERHERRELRAEMAKMELLQAEENNIEGKGLGTKTVANAKKKKAKKQQSLQRKNPKSGAGGGSNVKSSGNNGGGNGSSALSLTQQREADARDKSRRMRLRKRAQEAAERRMLEQQWTEDQEALERKEEAEAVQAATEAAAKAEKAAQKAAQAWWKQRGRDPKVGEEGKSSELTKLETTGFGGDGRGCLGDVGGSVGGGSEDCVGIGGSPFCNSPSSMMQTGTTTRTALTSDMYASATASPPCENVGLMTASECAVCFERIDHSHGRHPAAIIRCGHTSVCLACATAVWTAMGMRECPICG